MSPSATHAQGPQATRRARTRERLLRAAGKVFARRGFHGATLDEVAAAAGLTKGAVYHNFESKEDLFLTLLQERLERRLEDVRATFAAGGEPQRSGQRAARGFFNQLERDPRWPPLFFDFVAYAGRDPRLKRAFGRRFFETARATLSEVVARLFADTHLEPPIPPEHLAIAVDALANGLALERMFTPETVPDDLFGDLLALLFRALAAESTPTTQPRNGRSPHEQQ